MNAVIKRPGRPGRPPNPNPEPTQQVSILLPPELVERAREIGEGNLTEGIRRAVRAYRAPSAT